VEWLVWVFVVPIGYVVIGAAVLATLDPKGVLYRWSVEHKCTAQVVCLFPAFAWLIFTSRKSGILKKGF
jgi:hypothetical protein